MSSITASGARFAAVDTTRSCASEDPMPRGSKEAYTDKQKRQAQHIEEGYKQEGLSTDEAERRAWATVNKQDGGGKKSGSGRADAKESITSRGSTRSRPVPSKHRVNPRNTSRASQGDRTRMQPEPVTIRDDYVGTGRLAGKVALITGGDSGIGRAVAVHFARESCDVAIAYLDETSMHATPRHWSKRRAALPADPRRPAHAGALPVRGAQDACGIRPPRHPGAEPRRAASGRGTRATDPGADPKTFETNVFSYFYLVDAALPHMERRRLHRGSPHRSSPRAGTTRCSITPQARAHCRP
jgi:plasmid stabilization system protein ParE